MARRVLLSEIAAALCFSRRPGNSTSWTERRSRLHDTRRRLRSDNRGVLTSIEASEGKKQVTLQQTSSKRRIVDKASGSAEREWTAVEKFRLKGLAKQALPAEKIARTLKRPVDATVAMATKLGHRLM
jgi:hypothetical protein